MADERALPQLVEQMLKELGEDPHREGLEKTPERVAAALRYLTSGYAKDVHEILNDALFVEEYDEMVIVKDIDVTSLCEHHLLPFIGKVHVAYMPHRKIVGLSKIPRLVAMYLFAVTRDTVDSCIEIASATVLRLSGRRC